MARKSRRGPVPRRVISGGQTGVDRAALDVARALGLDHGGWCPLGRRAEDGPIAAHYELMETPTADYTERTEWNVRDADATLVLLHGKPAGGTALTIRLARKLKKPCRVVDLRLEPPPEETRVWLRERRVKVLNVAGPRESGWPGIYQLASDFLRQVLGGE